MLANKTFGPMITDWQTNGVVRTRVKVTATALIFAMLVYPIGFGPAHVYAKVGIVLVVACVQVFIWTRPSKPMKASR